MSLKIGWIALYRVMMDSPVWRADPHILKLFIYLLFKARHSREPKRYPGFEVKRGELVTSLAIIAEENEYMQNGAVKQWSRQKVMRMLDALEASGNIERLSDTYGTHINVCNYASYQDIAPSLSDTYGTDMEQVRTSSGTGPDIYNNVNPDKNDNHENNSQAREEREAKPKREPAGYTEAFETFWKEYPRKDGSKSKAFEYWKRDKLENRLPEMLAKLSEYRRTPQWQRDAGQYIPYAQKWLNERRYESEPEQMNGTARYAGTDMDGRPYSGKSLSDGLPRFT